MGKSKKARDAEVRRRKQRKKMMRISIGAAAVLALVIFISVMSFGGGHRAREGVDIDMVAMRDTMVYATMANILRNPANHEGQTIRVAGSYSNRFWDVTGSHYHFLVVQGQGGCCPRQMEFRRNGDYIFPDDYPAEGAAIELIGVFTRGERSFYLSVDEMIVIQ